MTVKLLTENHSECLSLKGGCTGSSEYTLVKMPHYWKSHVKAYMILAETRITPWSLGVMRVVVLFIDSHKHLT